MEASEFMSTCPERSLEKGYPEMSYFVTELQRFSLRS